MKSKFKFWLAGFLTLLITMGAVIAHTNSTIVSRLQLDWPDLGYEGGAGLHSTATTVVTKIGDNLNSRYYEQTINDTATVTIDHNFNVAFSDLQVQLYDGQGAAKVRITDYTTPSLSDFTIVATTGFEKTQIDITNNSGGNEDVSIEVISGIRRFEGIEVDGGTAANTSRITLPKDTTANLDALTKKEASLWYSTDQNTLLVDDGTQLLEISGSSGGAAEYIGNGSAEGGTTGWTDSGAEIEVTKSTIAPIRGAANFLMTTTASVTTADYIEYQFDLANADKNKTLQLSFEHEDGSSYSSGDFEVVVIKDPGGTEVEITPSLTEIPSTSSVNLFKATWTSREVDTYALRFKAATATTVYELKVDSVSVGPEIAVQTVPHSITDVSSLITFTSLGTTTDHKFILERNGSTARISGSARIGSTTTAAAYLNFDALNISIDTSKYATDRSVLGRAYRIRSAATTTNEFESTMSLFWRSGNDQRVGGGKTTESGGINELNNWGFSSNDYVSVDFTFEVAEWQGSSVNLAVTQAEYASTAGSTWDANSSSDGSDTVYGPVGEVMGGALTASRIKYVVWQTPVQDTDIIKLQLKQNVNSPWVDAGESSGAYDSSADTGAVVLSSSTPDVTRVVIKRYFSGTNNWDSGYSWRVVKYPGVIQSATIANSEPVSMDDVTATKLGYKVYEHGTTYSGGNAPTITLAGGGGTLSSVDNSSFMPYQVQDGSWRLKLNLTVILSSTSRTGVNIAIAGVDIHEGPAAANVSQGLNGSMGTSAVSMSRVFADGTTDQLRLSHGTVTTTTYMFSGDLKLASKPTWAY